MAAYILLATIAATAGVVEAQQLVTSYSVSEYQFSPDGDGLQDTTTIEYTLGVDAASVTLVVFESDSTSVVNTLVAGTPQPAGDYSPFWDGTYSGGAPAPEGEYVLRFFATSSSAPDTTIIRPLYLDLTPPVVTLLSREPGVYVPGIPSQPQLVQIVFSVTNSLERGPIPLGDNVALDAQTPAGANITDDLAVTVEPKYNGDGIYTLSWDGNDLTGKVDGRYGLTVTVTDYAGNSDAVTEQVDFNVQGPVIRYLDPEQDQVVTAVPDSLRGFAYDRHRVAGMFVSYFTDTDSMPVHSSYVRNDTFYFAVPLADSITSDGEYNLFFDAFDLYDRGRSSELAFTLDTSAPAAPTLDPFGGIWHAPVFPLKGEWSGNPNIIRIYVDGTVVDSIFTLLDDVIDRDVPLEAGENRIWVTAVDQAGNESANSNVLTVTFDDGSGLFLNTPFIPGDDFQLNLPRPAASAEVRIYDLGGDLVAILEDLSPRQNYVIRWGGTNGSGEDVKKGPLVAVAVATFDDGNTRVFREVFLFDRP